MHVTLRNVKEIPNIPDILQLCATILYRSDTQIIWKYPVAHVCHISENDSTFKGLDINCKKESNWVHKDHLC